MKVPNRMLALCAYRAKVVRGISALLRLTHCDGRYEDMDFTHTTLL